MIPQCPPLIPHDPPLVTHAQPLITHGLPLVSRMVAVPSNSHRSLGVTSILVAYLVTWHAGQGKVCSGQLRPLCLFTNNKSQAGSALVIHYYFQEPAPSVHRSVSRSSICAHNPLCLSILATAVFKHAKYDEQSCEGMQCNMFQRETQPASQNRRSGLGCRRCRETPMEVKQEKAMVGAGQGWLVWYDSRLQASSLVF